MMWKWMQRLLLPTVILLLVAGTVPQVSGQDETIITIAVPEWMNDVFDADLFGPFQDAHPGVKVVVVSSGQDSFYSPAAYGIDDHLKGAEKYASEADVLYVSNYNLSVEATRAGYFLDMTPLVTSDAALDTSDFFPAIWQSFQWDQGIWGLPVSASVDLLVYNADAFDAAGVAHPDEKWTLDDVVRAARLLTVKDDKGNVQVPGIDAYNIGLLFHSLLGEGFYDDSILPNPPKFTDPRLVTMLDTWAKLQKDMTVTGNYDFDKVPMSITQPWRLTNSAPDDKSHWAASLLPGGKAGIEPQGFAISRGTLNPEMAYELSKYLTTSPEVVTRFFGNTPARHSLVGVTVENSAFITPPVPKDVQALIDKALENAIPASELRYSDYLNVAINRMNEKNLDARSALQEVETEAFSNLETAAAKHDTTTVMVATPVPTPSFSANQIVLKFGLNLFTSPIPNRDQWDQFIKDYLAQTPAVGNVDLMTQVYQSSDLEKVDCYYQPYNAVSSTSLKDLLNLDPFMDADPNFNRDDFLKGVLDQVKVNDHIWGYPIVILPSIMWYDSTAFTKAGLPDPDVRWTVDTFTDALHMLKSSAGNDKPPFMPQTYGDTYLLMLMAAYGAVPYDFRTTPPTPNFTDAQVINGVRQVLDLAKEKYIDYKELANTSGQTFGGGGGAPIYSDNLSTATYQLQNRNNTSADVADPYRLTNYPEGSDLIPLAYGIGTAYIRAGAQSPDACYGFISQLARHPNLVMGMPAVKSLMNDPSVAIAQGDDVTALYQGFADKLEQPNTIIFPSESGGGSGGFGDYVEQFWMERAFDNYVLRDGDLETDLANTQQMITDFRGCTAPIPPFDPAILDNTDSSTKYFRQFADCAIRIDPTLKPMFASFYQEPQ